MDLVAPTAPESITSRPLPASPLLIAPLGSGRGPRTVIGVECRFLLFRLLRPRRSRENNSHAEHPFQTCLEVWGGRQQWKLGQLFSRDLLGGRRRRESQDARLPSRQLAGGRRRGRGRPARPRAFPPGSSGKSSRPPRPASCSATSSAAGDSPNASGSTTATPGARPAICPPIWRCG